MSTQTEAVAETTADERYLQIRKVTLVGSVLDLLLAVAKLVIGFLAHSQALIADGIHSLSDLATDAMVLIAAKHGSRDADESHPYGHGRIETLATVILGIALILVAIGIGWDAVRRLFSPEELWQPGVWALVVAGVSVVSKEWIYHYTMRVAKRLRSDMLKANAWHSRTDAISSIVVMVGVAGTMAGLPYLDAIAAVGVALMIAKIGWELGWNSIHELIDTGLEAQQVEAIRNVIQTVDGVRATHMLRTRRSGGDALVDVHILVDPRLSVSEGHFISETVEKRLVAEVPEVQDVLVHIDPEDDQTCSPCVGLPSRKEILEQLAVFWDKVPGAEKRTRVTLHYLDGQIEAEVALPLGAVASQEEARRLSEALSEPVDKIDVMRTIRVYYY